MNKLFYTLIFLFSVLYFPSAKATTSGWSWAEGFCGIADNESMGIVRDKAGNIYHAGVFSSPTIAFGTYTLTNTASGSGDIFVVKMNPAGAVIWAKSAGGASVDEVLAMAIDSADNIFITGIFESASITVGSVTLSCSSGSGDLFVFKLDTAGNAIWGYNTASPTVIAQGNGITTDASGNVYVGGDFQSPTITFGSTTLNCMTSWPNNNVFLLKLNAAGVPVWAKLIGAPFDAQGGKLTTDRSGDVYIAGVYDGGSAIIGPDTLTTTGSTDIFLAKYDSTGALRWAKKWGGNNSDGVMALMTDSSENLYMAGNYASDSIVFGASALLKIPGGTQDIFLAKLDSSGTGIWAKGAGGVSNSASEVAMTMDFAGNVLISGFFFCPSIVFGADTLTNLTQANMFITKYSAVGNVDWVVGADSGSIVGGGPLATAPDGSIYVAGGFSGASCQLGSFLIHNSGGISNSQIVIAKYLDSAFSTTKVQAEVKKVDKIFVYPNPNSGSMNVTLNNGGYTNIQGNLPGIYYLRSMGDGKCETIPFVINR